MKRTPPPKPRRRLMVAVVPGLEDDLKAIYALLREARELYSQRVVIPDAIASYRADLEEQRETRTGLFEPEYMAEKEKRSRSRKVPPWNPPIQPKPPSDTPHIGVMELYRRKGMTTHD